MRIDQELADIAHRAALSVAPYLKSVARTMPHFDTKRDFHDPVTEHDRLVEQRLRDFLGAQVPGSRFLGEEFGEEVLPSPAAPGTGEAPTKAATLGSRVRWIVDPIDGTANFASGLIYFCTSIAAELDGEVVAGAVVVPVVGESFVADAEEAWHVDADGTRAPMLADGPDSEATAIIATYYPQLAAFESDFDQAARDELELLRVYGSLRRPGAGALDLAHVAAGWLGVAMGPRFGPWDVAAGIHLVRVAGGSVLNLPLETDLPDGLRPAVVAQGRRLDAVTAKRMLIRLDEEARP